MASVPEIHVIPVILVALAVLCFAIYKHYSESKGFVAIAVRHTSFAFLITFSMVSVWAAALVAEHNAAGNAVILNLQNLMTEVYIGLLWVWVATMAIIITHFIFASALLLKAARENKAKNDPLAFSFDEVEE